MENVLTKIVQDKRTEIDRRKTSLPLESFRAGLTCSTRSFYQALDCETTQFIFECKKASPSKGLIREDFDLDEIIKAYRPYAACVSVLTDQKYFQGQHNDLRYVASQISQPVLNKDFIIDPYQIYLARHYQADAVLLMLSILDDETYKKLAELALMFEMDILTEISNEQEASRAVRLGASIIGINNRNLRDLSTDLATTEQLVPFLRSQGHPGLIISESGINTHQDVLRLAPLVDGFLVGSSLMAQTNLTRAVRQLVMGNTKICGITRLADAEFVASSGAAYMGLIFAERSPRFVTFAQASHLVSRVAFDYVGVFVNAPVTQVAEYAHKLGLAAVQLHGNESDEYISDLQAKLPADCRIWRALGVEDALPAMTCPTVDMYLLDCQINGHSGGLGNTFDWALLPAPAALPAFAVAGGLTPENIRQARATGACLLDVNSGVEEAPGVKSANRIEALFAQLRTY